MARLYLDTKPTQREERDQRTIGRCGTRVVPVSTNRHRRPPPMPGPIHRSAWPEEAFEPSPGSEDPCRSCSLFFSFDQEPLAFSFLFLCARSRLHGGRATSCQRSANYPCTTWRDVAFLATRETYRTISPRRLRYAVESGPSWFFGHFIAVTRTSLATGT